MSRFAARYPRGRRASNGTIHAGRGSIRCGRQCWSWNPKQPGRACRSLVRLFRSLQFLHLGPARGINGLRLLVHARLNQLRRCTRSKLQFGGIIVVPADLVAHL